LQLSQSVLSDALESPIFLSTSITSCSSTSITHSHNTNEHSPFSFLIAHLVYGRAFIEISGERNQYLLLIPMAVIYAHLMTDILPKVPTELYVDLNCRGHLVCLGGYPSVMLLSCSISIGALGSPDLLILYSHDNSSIARHHHTNNNPSILSFIPYINNQHRFYHVLCYGLVISMMGYAALNRVYQEYFGGEIIR